MFFPSIYGPRVFGPLIDGEKTRSATNCSDLVSKRYAKVLEYYSSALLKATSVKLLRSGSIEI